MDQRFMIADRSPETSAGRAARALRRLLFLALIVGGCGEESGGWQVVDDHVEGHLLSAWCDGSRPLIVGGSPGEGLILSTAATSWEAAGDAGDNTLRWIWGGGAEGPVVVGDGGAVLRLQSGAWTPQFSSLDEQATLWGVWGRASDDVWAVGGVFQEGGTHGLVIHWGGDAWVPLAVDSSGTTLFKIWGCGDQAWIVGEHGTILALEGEDWVAEASPTEADLYTVHGTSDCEKVWAVGLLREEGRGVVLERKGSAWSVLADDVEAPLFGVCGDAEETWVVGTAGFAARVVDGQLKKDPIRTDLDLHACVRTASCGLWVVGGDLFGTGSAPRGVVAHQGTRVPAGPVGGSVVDGGMDMGLPSGSIGEGEECPTGATSSCKAGLRCWYLMDARRFVCTEECETGDFCSSQGYPPSCCARPGSQTTKTVCIPETFEVCP